MTASTKNYAGIGARKTPGEIQEHMTAAAQFLQDQGWKLRTGGAQGADSAFLKGITNYAMVDVFIPWEGFQGFTGKDYPVKVLGAMEHSLQSEAASIAQEYHPYWSRLTPAEQKLMARNSFQVLGHDLETPAQFVMCWTPGGNGSGGTGQAIRIANGYDIPVFDLGKLSLVEIDNALQELLK